MDEEQTKRYKLRPSRPRIFKTDSAREEKIEARARRPKAKKINKRQLGNTIHLKTQHQRWESLKIALSLNDDSLANLLISKYETCSKFHEGTVAANANNMLCRTIMEVLEKPLASPVVITVKNVKHVLNQSTEKMDSASVRYLTPKKLTDSGISNPKRQRSEGEPENSTLPPKGFGQSENTMPTEYLKMETEPSALEDDLVNCGYSTSPTNCHYVDSETENITGRSELSATKHEPLKEINEEEEVDHSSTPATDSDEVEEEEVNNSSKQATGSDEVEEVNQSSKPATDSDKDEEEDVTSDPEELSCEEEPEVRESDPEWEPKSVKPRKLKPYSSLRMKVNLMMMWNRVRLMMEWSRACPKNLLTTINLQ